MLKIKEKIKEWLMNQGIFNFTLNKDLSVDVKESVEIIFKNLQSLPVQFNIIEGDFNCSNNRLITLKGCPKKVYGTFSCNNNQLKTLEFGPEYVDDCFLCNDNKLKDLKYSPTFVGNQYSCDDNKITTLEDIYNITIRGEFTYFGNDLPFKESLSLEEIRKYYVQEKILQETEDLAQQINKKKKI